jgi:histidinol-phosphatase (PHP family)
MARMAQTGLFHLAGHLDLVKKFDFRPTVDLSREIGATLDAIAGSGMAIELNTSGWSKPCRAPYPSEDLLRDAVARGIPVVITSDVHRKADLDRHFDQAVEMLRRLSVTETLRFSGGKAVRAAL